MNKLITNVLVCEALLEDRREGQHFDAEGFSNFCPEEEPDIIRDAWLLYDRIVYGDEPVTIIGELPPAYTVTA